MVKKKYKAVIYIVLSAFCFALMGLFVTESGDLPTMQKVFFRNFFALFIAIGSLKKSGTKFEIGDKKNHAVLFVRAFGGTIGMIGNFYALGKMNLSDALMLNKMSPFFVIVFSYIFLKEKLTRFQLLTVLGAFGGSLFIIKPSFSNVDLFPAICGFLGGMGAGLAYTCVRYLGQHGVKGPVIVAYFSGFSCLFTLPFLIFGFKPMTLAQFLCLLGAGISAAGGQFSITAAYSHAPAKEISVYDYSQLIFTTILGMIFLHQFPDKWSFVGYIIIITMAVLVFIYNNFRHKESDAENKTA
ncbi:DMT family transporter [Ruminococcus sp.]|uniref:DMT family transporter n=1 Tax=Ruminococcus sp. TaxID=41978 RepID=UPI001B0FCA4D|nr:DMT family transporter [Ruminococcus sp.]MBO5559252.1 DMT family transporter [Ruminococcus sp.]